MLRAFVTVTLATFFAAVCLLLVDPSSAQEEIGWSAASRILAEIREPAFPDRDFLVTGFGATADGRTDCRAAMQEAIDACAEAGGGRVIVPPGEWLVAGPVHLRSRVNWFLSEGACVRFSTDPDDYLPVVLTRFEGNELMNYSPLVYAMDQRQIAITGSGTLDGGAGPAAWWPWKAGGSGDGDQTQDVEQLRRQADDAIPVAERVYGDGHHLRPNFIQLYRCQDVLIEGVTIVRSPMWVVHPVLCTSVTVRGVSVDSHGPNNDGCNPESCRHVLIESCRFDTGDDCIAIKSGRNAEGRRLGVPSENIVVRNCTMADGHGGVVLGSEMSGGIRNIFVEDCRMSSPNLERAIRLKSNSLRGGYLENLYVRHVEVGEVSESVIHINLEYSNETGEYFPAVRNLYIDHVVSQNSERALYLVGLAGYAIQNVRLRDCVFENVRQPSIIEHVRDLRLTNVSQPR